MALKLQTHIKVDGIYVKGTIIGNTYRTENVIVPQTRNQMHGYSVTEVEEMIKELQQLKEAMDSVIVADKLANIKN